MSKKNVTPYFSHDADARDDPKIVSVRLKYGLEGYGLYWVIIEKLRMQSDFKLERDYEAIAFDCRVKYDKIDMIKDVIENFGLFSFTDDGKYFYSDSLNERMRYMIDIQEKRAESGRKGAEARWGKRKTQKKRMKEKQKQRMAK